MKLLTDEELRQALDKDIFHLISETADELGLECYVIGGYVRDLFLERPSNDIDVVVIRKPLSDSPEGERSKTTPIGCLIASEVQKKLGHFDMLRSGQKAHLAVFKNFGTAQLKWNGIEIEFVGARKESYSHDSRKPVVEDGTIEDDQNRRDFTINAMALCLNGDRFGELVDPFDGLYDLEDGIIATPLDPDITFSDDPLRMMRCIRFATQLNFYIEDETFEALERNKERIRIISGERIAEELNKIIMSPTPSKGFIDLERCGLLEIIFPELYALQGIESRNGRAHKDNFYHTLEVLDNVAKQTDPESSLWLRWAAILHDIGKPKSKKWDNVQGWTFHNHNYIGEKMVPQIFRRMKLPMNEKMKYVEKLVGLHMRPIAIADDEVTDSAVRRLLFEAGDDIDDLMLLCNADITSKNEERKRQFRQNFALVKEKLVAIEEKDRIRNMKFAVDGEEIMQMFGLQPSREVGMLKNAMKEAILDGIIPNEHDACVEFLRKVRRESEC
ncbi:MAG: HD domain-containing protein [Bacteroidaceae bacterium]|nr:HD domain-containing protein [Bacteroidaceae bacterium]